MDWFVILSIGLVGGTLLTLFFISRRPINVNLKVDARAEAHGGSASVSAPESIVGDGGSVGGFVGGIFNLFKFLVIAAIAILVLVALTQKNEPAQVIVKVPEQKPPVVNFPAQQPPVVNVQVPQQKTPVVNVSASDGLNYLNTILSLLGVIIGGSMLFFVIRRKPNRGLAGSGEDHANAEYVKTDYGYTLAPKSKQPTTAEYPDLFTRDKVRK